MKRLATCVAVASLSSTALAFDQTAASGTPPVWAITDNSFLVEEAFNQQPGIVQNIFSWTRERSGDWTGTFTQEWPAPNLTHQLSYVVPFAAIEDHRGLGDIIVNYRYQLRTEERGGPAVAPRASLILPTGREQDGLGAGGVGLQVSVPASKQFGDLYVHANAGWTWFPRRSSAPQLAASGIWRTTPMFNLMLEGTIDGKESATISPGLRRGWNRGPAQAVVGAAVPVTRSAGSTTAALLIYASYELPFR